jgi:hypothetical protein
MLMFVPHRQLPPFQHSLMFVGKASGLPKSEVKFVLVSDRPFQPSLMFVGMARSEAMFVFVPIRLFQPSLLFVSKAMSLS